MDLIKDFHQQVKIIENLEQNIKTDQTDKKKNKNSKKRILQKNDSELEETCLSDESDFEHSKFDNNFFNDIENIPNLYDISKIKNKNDNKILTDDLLFLNYSRILNDDIPKEKWSYKMISFCKSLHFFNIKNMLFPCKHCKKKFTSNGMGGHVSRQHKNTSIDFKRREKTKILRKVNKERQEKFMKMKTNN